MQKQRLDLLLVERGLVESRALAQRLVMAGQVRVNGQVALKPSDKVSDQDELTVEHGPRYVSRGGEKLEAALNAFEVAVTGRVCADVGASTGGFTDCLLQRGAGKVSAVDVDPRQLASRLAADPRVVRIRKNARALAPSDFAEPVQVAVMDLAFISLLKVLPAVAAFLGGGDLVALVKPQFEAGRRQVGKKGVVRDPTVHEEVLVRVVGEAARLGFGARGLCRSPILGQRGNREFFVHWVPGGGGLDADAVRSRVKETIGHEND